MAVTHIRKPLPKKGGNSFYRDNRIFTATTLCGEAVTDRDVDYRYGGTKTFQKWTASALVCQHGLVCQDCVKLRKG
jgi:hypothetical protein